MEIEKETQQVKEFKLDRKTFMSNLLKIIPEMEKVRKQAEEILPNLKDPDKKVLAPDSKTIQNDLIKICSVPHRRIGTKEENEIEDYIEAKFKEMGLENINKEPVSVINWAATNWKLSISTGDGSIEFPCFYVLNTEFTSKEGISAPLVYVETGTKRDFRKVDVKDKIVVADIEMPTLPLGKLLNLAKIYYLADPKNTIDETSEVILTFALTNFPPQTLGGPPRKDSVYWRAVQGGALGIILILRDYVSNVNTHWGPYDGAMKQIPGLYVGKYDGMKLRELVQSNECKGNLTLEGYKEPGIAHNVWGILPGKTDEMIMVSSHHDSAFEGASEDGTGIAMVLAQLRAWSKVPKEERQRSLLFVLTAGHLYGGIGAETFAQKYKEGMLKKVLVDVNLEHMCAKDVEEDPETHDYKLLNNLAIGAVFLSQNPMLVAQTIKAFKEYDIERMMLIPDNYFGTVPIGEAGHFVNQIEDMKVIHWIRSPYYLLTAEDTLDKIDMDKLGSTSQAVTNIINSLMYLPKNNF